MKKFIWDTLMSFWEKVCHRGTETQRKNYVNFKSSIQNISSKTIISQINLKPQCLSASVANSNYLIDLQLFAAEDEGRTEEGSDRRRREEQDKGNVPKSTELPAALVLVAAILALYLLGNYIFVRSFVLFKKYFQDFAMRTEFNAEEFGILLKSASADIASLLLPILGVTFIAAIVGNVVQVGFMFSPGAVSFNFNKIVPKFGKVLPTKNTMYNLVKSIGKIVIIGWVSYIIISMDFLPILLMGDMGLKGALRLLAISSVKIFLVVGIILFALSIYDYFYQKDQFEDSIKMTPSEAKQEMKESEGDRSLLNRRRQMVRDFIKRGMLQRVPKADVVIVNPTHYSVALVYDSKVNAAPIVTAKGIDELALMIRRLAKKHGIPIVEDRVQARLLYDEVEVDEEIPSKFFRAVSIIISRLDKFRRVA